MGLFGNTKKSVSNREFQNSVRSRLSSSGLTRDEINEVAMIFRADLDEPQESQKGIDAEELSAGIKWMRQHTDMHHLSTTEIDSTEEVLRKYI